jgi:hypothetical protein
MRADAFLAGGHQMCGKQPFVQRNMRFLIERAHDCRERLLAGAAFIEARARAFAMQLGCFVYSAAMRANRTIRPAHFFEMRAGGVFIGECLVGKIAGHGHILLVWLHPTRLIAVCQVHNSL